MSDAPHQWNNPEDPRRDLASLSATIQSRIGICLATVGELRRQHQALIRRRSGAGSPGARKHALGSTLVMVGVDGVDDTALLGLLGHPDQMLGWMAQARRNGAGPMFGDLVRAVFADEATFAWCHQWGRILQWRYRKPLYDAAVQSFLDSGRAGPREKWRLDVVTDDQAALILTLVDVLQDPTPDLSTRGEAFEWIHERGGNPDYWREPSLPPYPGG